MSLYQIHMPPKKPREVFEQYKVGVVETFSLVRLELDEEIHVASRFVEVIARRRADEKQLAYPMAPAQPANGL